MSAVAADRLTAISNHLASSRLVVVLPDGAKLTSSSSTRNGQEITQLLLDGKNIAECTVFLDKTYAFDQTSVNTPFEGVTKHVPQYALVNLRPATSGSSIAVEDVWAAIYALFTAYHSQEYIPTLISALKNAQEIADYLISSGLARTYPSSLKSPKSSSYTVDEVFYLNRAAFWQAAGTTGYHNRQSWLQHQTPLFPEVMSFTRSEKVIAKHPLRPTKPRPGQLLYRRWCSAVGQMLELTYFDLDGVADAPGQTVNGVSRHLAAFHKWHNDPRVNSAWQEEGTLEGHRKYIEGQYNDPHAIPCMFSWDGVLFGYIEINYTKEDHTAQHFPLDIPVGDWDRGIHVLVGESSFLGGGRSEIWMRSLVHYIFLADPRTGRVVGEPNHANPNIIRVANKSGFYMPTVFDFPYKRSALVLHPREKFFGQCKLR